jgi:hypothetical protein
MMTLRFHQNTQAFYSLPPFFGCSFRANHFRVHPLTTLAEMSQIVARNDTTFLQVFDRDCRSIKNFIGMPIVDRRLAVSCQKPKAPLSTHRLILAAR